MGITLMVVGLIASLALALSNQYTSGLIADQTSTELQKSLKVVMPDADDFKQKDYYYEAYKNSQLIGKVVTIETSGYSSMIKLLVGLDNSNKIVGVKVLSQVETPGLGSRIQEESFLSQFIGKDAAALKLKKDGGNIDGITGATISSRAVVNSIQEALKNG